MCGGVGRNRMYILAELRKRGYVVAAVFLVCFDCCCDSQDELMMECFDVGRSSNAENKGRRTEKDKEGDRRYAIQQSGQGMLPPPSSLTPIPTIPLVVFFY